MEVLIRYVHNYNPYLHRHLDLVPNEIRTEMVG